MIDTLVGIFSWGLFFFKFDKKINNKLSNIKAFFLSFFLLLLTLFSGFVLLFGVLFLLFNQNSNSNKMSFSETKINLNADKIWNLVNNWEKSQGFQPYVKNDKLCQFAENALPNINAWTKAKYDKPEFSYFNYSWNTSYGNSEEAVLNNWVSNTATLKNLKDYYYYSCIKCKANFCVQLFMNVSSPKSYVVSEDINTPWGVAKQISDHTWTMKIGEDAQMGSPDEIFKALNYYRNNKGRSSLVWDDRLANYAKVRASYFTSIGKLDEHAGFNEYVKDPNNLRNLGFWNIGENSSFGYKVNGVHLIEWVYAGDKPHDDNQLNSGWTNVGIGVDNYQTDIIFGAHGM